MKTITIRDCIREIASEWDQKYGPFSRWANDHNKNRIGTELAALDRETATAEDVAAIIGNDGWTHLKCHECGQTVEAVVEVGEEPDYESCTARLCLPCVQSAAQALSAAVAEGGAA